jgi:transposase, IS6 family
MLEWAAIGSTCSTVDKHSRLIGATPEQPIAFLCKAIKTMSQSPPSLIATGGLADCPEAILRLRPERYVSRHVEQRTYKSLTT